MQAAGPEHFADARGTIRIRAGIMQRLFVGVIPREQVIVRRLKVALLRMSDVRQRVDRQVTVPLIPAVAGHRNQPRPVRPQRRDRHRLIADVPRAVRPHHVLRWNPAVGTGFGKFLP